MYPYPSGDLHIGHWYIVTPSDALARYRRMHGYNVFFPIGFDAFGLPAENAAIKSGGHPFTWTMQNIETMRRQFRTMGAMFAWKSRGRHRGSRRTTTGTSGCSCGSWRLASPTARCPRSTGAPTTGRWRASRSKASIADCWRCGALVEKRDLEQWFLQDDRSMPTSCSASTASSGPSRSASSRRTGSGAPKGAEIDFTTAADDHHPGGEVLRVFTTRPDTLFGATFMVLAPEHPLVDSLTHPDRWEEVAAYVGQARRRTEIDRLSTDREKTGVALGPRPSTRSTASGSRSSSPTTSCPATARARSWPFPPTTSATSRSPRSSGCRSGGSSRRPTSRPTAPWTTAFIAHAADERLVNSGPFDGLPADVGGKAIVDKLAAAGRASPKVTYRLRDWLFSRQRYWGTPIPVIYCEVDGIVPIPDDQLPVLLPETVDYRGSGDNPLTRDEAFLHVDCPRCGRPARRETDTMDTFIDSSWYWFRYLSPDKDDGPFDQDLVERWTPVDQYTGGAEHAVMHLMYARFVTKAMADIGLVTQREPFKRLFNQGQILGADGERMSKSRGNVQDPDELVGRYGADTVRLFLMFMGPWDQGGPWSPTGIGGVHRFLNRIWTLVIDPHGREPGDPDAASLPAGEDAAAAAAALRAAAHRTLRDVTADYEAFHFNTMVAKLMELANTLFRYRGTSASPARPAWDEAIRLLLLMLAPAAPHITRGTVEPAPSRRWRRRGPRSTPSRGPWSMSPPRPSRRARSRCRSTASCATS